MSFEVHYIIPQHISYLVFLSVFLTFQGFWTLCCNVNDMDKLHQNLQYSLTHFHNVPEILCALHSLVSMATEPHSEGESDPVELQGEVFGWHAELQVSAPVDRETRPRRPHRHAACKWRHLLVMFGHRNICKDVFRLQIVSLLWSRHW